MCRTDAAIELQGVTKRFGNTVALDRLDLSVPTGQVHGFLGPNGAGKSTAIRVLLGLLRPDAGTARLLGGDPWADAARLHRHIAYVPGDVSLWPNLSGGEAIDLIARAHGGIDPRRRDDLIERFQLDPTRRGRAYSKGNRQKVVLIAALATDADVLLLDEPTSGLDPLMERCFGDLIEAEAGSGRTVLLSSHILSEVERLCTHVSIIKNGHIVETGSLDELRHLHLIHVTAVVDRPSELRGIAGDPGTAGIHGVHDLLVAGDEVSFKVTPEALSPAVATLAAAGLRSLSSAPPTLEELFVSHYTTST
jgi:ABC-2 type transport system ATP-binding protein